MRPLLTIGLIGWLHALSAHAKLGRPRQHGGTLPSNWTLDSKAPQKTSISISIALAQPGLANLEDALLQRASQTPLAFSFAEIKGFQEPKEDAAAKVISWLDQNGVDGAVQTGPWIKVNATVETLDTLFGTDMAYYTYNSSHPSSGDYTVMRSQSYSVPAALDAYIDFIFPLSHFMCPTNVRRLDNQMGQEQSLHDEKRAHAFSTSSTACVLGSVTPDCIREVYKWPYPNLSNTKKIQLPVRFGIAGFLDEYINYEDVDDFLKTYSPSLLQHGTSESAYNFTTALVNGGVNIQTPRYRAGIEASLDVQYAMALAYPSQIIYYSTGGRGDKIDQNGHLMDPRHSNNEPYLELLEYLVALPDSSLPHVLSVSYSDDEQSVPKPYAIRVCQLFMQLTARGTTVLVATGDGGSRGIGHSQCTRNDGSGQRTLLPTFPASCPWVTAVGATKEPSVASGNMASPPTVVADYSSGGFSDYFPRPSWQDKHVSSYISGSAGTDKRGLFNTTGRAVPDISAMGSKFQVVWRGKVSSVDGTSASTPLLASMVAMANDERLRAGRTALGWLNPILYSDRVQNILQDITDGVTRSCPFDDTDTVPGWPATPGWDAATGLGVPSDYSEFLKVLVDV